MIHNCPAVRSTDANRTAECKAHDGIKGLSCRFENPDATVGSWSVFVYVCKIEIESDPYPVLGRAGRKENRLCASRKTLGPRGLDVETNVSQCRLDSLRHVFVELQPQDHDERLCWYVKDSFASEVGGVTDGCRNVLWLEGRIFLKNGRGGLTCSKVVKHDGHWYPCASKAHGAMHDLRVGVDEGLPIHGGLGWAIRDPESYPCVSACKPDATRGRAG